MKTVISKLSQRLFAAQSLLVAAALLAATTHTRADHSPGQHAQSVIVPGQARILGKSMAAWSAEHWKWIYSLPVDAHPLFDTADFAESQPFEHVWFLGGTYSATPDADGNLVAVANRSVTVPAGTLLFFPIVNVEASVLEGNGTTEEELRATAQWLQDHAQDLTCTVDGKAVPNLNGRRVQSPLFTIGPVPDNNVFEATGVPAPEGTTTDSVADGVFVMVLPVTPGKHTIHYSGSIVFTEAEDGFDFVFSQDITYEINVVPPR